MNPLYEDRETAGEFKSLFKAMHIRNHNHFFAYTRMEVWQFDELLRLTQPMLVKKSRRKPIQPDMMLAMTLKYLAHGGSMQSLAWNYRVGRTTARKVVLFTCTAIWETLCKTFVKLPSTDQEWEAIVNDFWQLWNFPNTVGAIDGKHVQINCPPSAGSEWHCYKQFHSLVLMAACDAKYRFTWVDVGGYGSHSDGGVFAASSFGTAVLNGNITLPSDRPLPGTDLPSYPLWFVADAAFPLKKNILRPYPGKYLQKKSDIFNYRLSRARRIIENSFGILVARWRIFQTKINGTPDNVAKMVLACIALHNFVMTTNVTLESRYCNDRYVDQDEQGHFIPGNGGRK